VTSDRRARHEPPATFRSGGADPLPELRAEETEGLPGDTQLRYRRVAAMLREVGEKPAPVPSVAWQQRVLGAMESQRRARARRTRAWVAGSSAAAALAAITLYLVTRSESLGEPTLIADIVSSGQPHLGNAQPNIAYRNDKLVVRAIAPGPAEIRVYDERGSLVARCGDAIAPGCTSSGDRDRREYRLELTLQQLGKLRPLLLVGDSIPPPAGSMDQDLGATRDIRTVTLTPIRVL
jgi:hypothetical protein